MEFYVTQYALTKGILKYDEHNTKSISICEDGYVNIVDTSEDWHIFKIGKDCYETVEDARRKAEHMRLAKIRNLEKKLEKLKSLTFFEEGENR